MLHSMKLQGKGSRLDALSHGVYDRRKLALAQQTPMIMTKLVRTDALSIGNTQNYAQGNDWVITLTIMKARHECGKVIKPLCMGLVCRSPVIALENQDGPREHGLGPTGRQVPAVDQKDS